MTRALCNAVVLSLCALPVLAQEATGVADLPVGVIIYDAVSEPAAPVVEVEPVASNEAPSAVPEIVLAPMTQSLASTRSSVVQTLPPVEAGTEFDSTTVAPLVDLAPGEKVLRAVAVPSIVKIPAPQPVYTATFKSEPVNEPLVIPKPVVDPVTGRLRDTVGWTGDTAGPASIGCFPAGACAVLNQQ